VNPAHVAANVVPYVQVRHAIHLLYATSPRSRDAAPSNEIGSGRLNHRYDKHGNPLPLELHGCGCSLCARQQRIAHDYWESR
jgi:hypothetical protein